MRQYQPIWEKLKAMPLQEAAKTGVSVTANRVLHPRIVKAVAKEKWKDLAYKSAISPLTTILSFKRNNAILTFYLHISAGSVKLLDHRHL